MSDDAQQAAAVESSEISKETPEEITEVQVSSSLAKVELDDNGGEKNSGESGTEATEKGVAEKGEEGDDGFETPEEGEGEEGDAPLDDDEIVENPAYIPKTGRFYMHDSRREEEEEVREAKKPSRADGMWSHDRFQETYQKPRTRKELMDKYGFDIRLGETKEQASELEEESRKKGGVTEGGKERTERGNGRGRGQGAPRWRGNNRPVQAERGRTDEEGADDERPAQRRDVRGRGGRGGRPPFGDGAPPPPRYNRTFNNSNRPTGRDESRQDAPVTSKRYSAQRETKEGGRRQPTDIVYFDPSQQSTLVAAPPPRREKKPLEIVAPGE